MPTSANVIADPAHHRCIRSRQLLDGQSVGPKQTINWIRVLGGKELAHRIRLEVQLGTGDVKRTRCNQTQQRMLVDWQQVLMPR